MLALRGLDVRAGMLHAVFAIAWAEDVGMLGETARGMWWERKTACALLNINMARTHKHAHKHTRAEYTPERTLTNTG